MGEAKRRRRQQAKVHRLSEERLLLSDSVDPLDEAYSAAVREIEEHGVAEVKAGQPPGVYLTTVLHDDGCPKLTGGVCRCTPEVRVARYQSP